jgi:hypothetical protein
MRIPAVVCLSLLVAGVAHADPVQDALGAVAKCTEIADAGDRLKCFDQAGTLAKSALAPPSKAEKEKTFLEWFGFSKPPPPQTTESFGKPPPPPGPEEVTSITSNVLEFARTPRGQCIFILANGQVWRQSEGDTSVVRDPVPGTPMKVTVENGFLGSYNLTIEGRNGLIKVTRLK